AFPRSGGRLRLQGHSEILARIRRGGRFLPMLSRLRKALRRKALRRVRERWRGRGWRRVRRAAAVGRKGTTVAIFQIRGQAVAGSGRTTFSLRDLYLRSRLGAATRRQSQDADKA